MTTTAEQLVELSTQLLSQRTASAYPTNANARVYAPRDWPTWDNEYPALFASIERERKRSLGSAGAPEFEVTATLRITARDSAVGSAVAGAGRLLASLGTLRRQIETTLINNPALMILLEQVGEVRADTVYKATGEKHFGEMQMELELQFYQGPEDFFPVTGTPLTTVTLATQYPTPTPSPPVGFELTLPQS